MARASTAPDTWERSPIRLALVGVVYLAIVAAFLDRRDWLRLFTAFAVAAVLSILYALAQYGGYDPLPWSIDSAVRPFSTIGNPDTYGHFVTVSLVAAAAVAATPSDL